MSDAETIAVLQAKREHAERALADHEVRLRRIERWQWAIVGASAGGASFAANYLSNIL